MRSYYIGMARGVVVIERHSAVGAALPLDPSVHSRRTLSPPTIERMFSTARGPGRPSLRSSAVGVTFPPRGSATPTSRQSAACARPLISGLIVTPRLSGHEEQASLAFAQLENVTASFQVSLFGVKAMHEGHVAAVERALFGRRRGCDGAVPSLDCGRPQWAGRGAIRSIRAGESATRSLAAERRGPGSFRSSCEDVSGARPTPPQTRKSRPLVVRTPQGGMRRTAICSTTLA